MKTTTALKDILLPCRKDWADLSSKLYRIGLHLTCLLVHPIGHHRFHLSGIAREFRHYQPNMMSDRHAIRNGKLAKVRQAFGEGKVIATERTVELLETVVEPGNRIILEGDNQKQGDFLAAQLARMNPDKVYGLKLCVSSVGLPEHLDLFESGLATELDFAYAAPQAARLARMV